jgi:hypothetical protein
VIVKLGWWQGALFTGALAAVACAPGTSGSGSTAGGSAAIGGQGGAAADGGGGRFAGGALAAGSAALPIAAADSGGACNAPSDVFPVTCASIVCHEGNANKLDLLSPGVEQRLLDVPAMGVHCGKTGMKLVDSASPEQSLILQKLTTSPPCGSPMPLGSGPSGLKPEQLTCIHDYVFKLAGH